MKAVKMLNSKLIRAIFTISLMLLACTVKVSAAEKLLPEQYSDLPTGWSREAIVSAIDNGLLYGYNNKIYPKDYLTRAQLASVVNRAFGTSLLADLSSYTDVPQNTWFTEDLSFSVYSKRMVGYNNRLYPQRDATREEVYAVLARAINVSSAGNLSTVQAFTDYNEVSPWATGELAAMVEKGYMRGVSGRLQPKSKMTREEFAYVLQSFSEYYIFAQAADLKEPEEKYSLEINDQELSKYGNALVAGNVGDTTEHENNEMLNQTFALASSQVNISNVTTDEVVAAYVSNTSSNRNNNNSSNGNVIAHNDGDKASVYSKTTLCESEAGDAEVIDDNNSRANESGLNVASNNLSSQNDDVSRGWNEDTGSAVFACA